MDEKWMGEHEKALIEMVNGRDYPIVGYIGWACTRKVDTTSIEMSWYPDLCGRFHEVRILLPRDQFITCVDCPDYDGRPHVFVKSEWLSELYLRAYSVFAMVDVIGVKAALRSGTLTRDKLVRLRDGIDEFAKGYPDISFVSFADSLLIKSNWSVGQYASHVKYTYKPEVFIRLIYDLRSIYREILEMEVYAILTQGSNEYYDDTLLHISPTNNHVSLNSLGVPFAQLLAIDSAARRAIHDDTHKPAELYMDENFYHSLRFVSGFDKNTGQENAYQSPLTSGGSSYFYSDHQTIIGNLDSQ